MKILLLEPDNNVANGIIAHLNETRAKFDVTYIQEEQEVFQEESFLHEYDLFILNLNDPIDTRIKRYIRNNGGSAPILLVLEKGIEPAKLKTIYYLSYNCIMIKDFFPEEITFHIYKLCNLWNDDVYFISKNTYFDFRESTFVHNENSVHLGKKEAHLLKLQFLKAPYTISCDEIAYHVYEDEVVTQESIRSLIRMLRNKLPFEMIETIKGKGYKLVSFEDNPQCLWSKSE